MKNLLQCTLSLPSKPVDIELASHPLSNWPQIPIISRTWTHTTSTKTWFCRYETTTLLALHRVLIVLINNRFRFEPAWASCDSVSNRENVFAGITYRRRRVFKSIISMIFVENLIKKYSIILHTSILGEKCLTVRKVMSLWSIFSKITEKQVFVTVFTPFGNEFVVRAFVMINWQKLFLSSNFFQ